MHGIIFGKVRKRGLRLSLEWGTWWLGVREEAEASHCVFLNWVSPHICLHHVLREEGGMKEGRSIQVIGPFQL